MPDKEKLISKRGDPAPDRQLSKMQRNILVWVLEEQESADSIVVKRRGIKWNSKALHVALDMDITGSSSVVVSKALSKLVKRGLISRTAVGKTQLHTDFVQLTLLGRIAAIQHIEYDGLTERQYKRSGEFFLSAGDGEEWGVSINGNPPISPLRPFIGGFDAVYSAYTVSDPKHPEWKIIVKLRIDRLKKNAKSGEYKIRNRKEWSW